MSTFTHADLCALAVKWLKRNNSAGGPGCAVALSECRSGYLGEIPDAIGYRASGHHDGTYVVEVKVSRSDFLADARKPHRISGGLGNWRHFMAPEGLIRVDELPTGWGLLEVNGRGHVKRRAGVAAHFHQGYDELERAYAQWRQEADHAREQWLLVRAVANAGDPMEALSRLREANNRASRLAAELEREIKNRRDRERRRIAGTADEMPLPRRSVGVMP